MKQELASVLQLHRNANSPRPQMFGDVITKCSTGQMPSNADSIALTFEDIRARFSAVKSDSKRTMNSIARPRQTMVIGDVKRDDDVRSDVIVQPRTTRAPSVGKCSEQLANVRFSRKCEDKENFFYRLQKSNRVPVGTDVAGRARVESPCCLGEEDCWIRECRQSKLDRRTSDLRFKPTRKIRHSRGIRFNDAERNVTLVSQSPKS